ncbi:Eukaryotic-type carbonic anhydrase [Phytophthora infestans]|uniref:carbonic anhydrase n=1 Tax=Phytophthora infestans TaxID=4787 RepID=A0A8S9V6U2_PHYIN|nr:Eukaryotic-type carbonic anhydrase [Phytophthora infestans]
MKFIVTISAIVAACGLAASSVAAAGADGAPWDYNPKDTQRASPAQWGEYYPACNGTNQSPIDIVPTDVEQRSKLRSTLRFRGSCPSFNLTQSGEGYKGAVIDGSCQVKANKAHNADGSALLLIVVGVFMEIDPSGNTDPWLEAVIDGIDDVSSTKPAMLDLTSYSALIKKSVGRGALYNCPGSLTTPGCDEIVDWWVVEKPMRISAKDLTCIRENQGEIEMNYKNENSRPVQALNDRTIQSFK